MGKIYQRHQLAKSTAHFSYNNKFHGPFQPQLIGRTSARRRCFFRSLDTNTAPYADASPSYLFGVNSVVDWPKSIYHAIIKKQIARTTSKITGKKPEDRFVQLAANIDALSFALCPNHKKASKSTSKGIAGTADIEFSSSFKNNLRGERISFTATDPPTISRFHSAMTPVLAATSLNNYRPSSTRTT